MRLLIISLFLFVFILCLYKDGGFISQAADVEKKEDFQNIAGSQRNKDGIRIVISTSVPVEFTSQWLNSPPSLIVEFQSKNVHSKIDHEIIVNQDIIKKVTAGYYEKGQGESLKSLVFELSEKMPYKIHQAGNAILIDIETSVRPFAARFQKEIITPNEGKVEIAKRLAAMDKTLMQIEDDIMPQEDVFRVSEFLKAAPIEKNSREIEKTDKKTVLQDIEVFLPVISPKKIPCKKALFLLIYPILLLSLGTFVTKHIKYIKHRVAPDYDKRFTELNSRPQEKDECLEQEEIILNAIEQEELQKEKDCQKVDKSMEALKDVLVRKGMLYRSLSSEEEKSWMPVQFVEKRKFVRLNLSRGYNRTVLLRVESEDKFKSLKCFADNISLGGLHLEAEKEFREGELLNLRLFFFGDKVPMMRLKAEVKWVKMLPPFYYCGLSFISQKEKDKTELNRYIESNIGRGC